MTQTIEQLQARVAELEAENARLKVMEESALKVCGQLDEVVIALPYDYLDPPDGGDVSLGEQVTRMYSEVKTLRHAVVIAQAEIKRLHDALQTYIDEHEECQDADDWMAMMCSMEAHHVADETLAQPSDTYALDAYVAEKVKEYQKHNGILGREVKDLTRQRDLAVEALKRIPDVEWWEDARSIVEQALSIIKESEGK